MTKLKPTGSSKPIQEAMKNEMNAAAKFIRVGKPSSSEQKKINKV